MTVQNKFSKTYIAVKYVLINVAHEKYGKTYMLLILVTSIMNAVFPLIYTIFPGLIINELLNYRRINMLTFYVGVLTLTPVINNIRTNALGWHTERVKQLLDLKFIEKFLFHTMSMDYECLENPETQIMKDRAGSTLSGIIEVIDRLGTLISAVAGLVVFMVIIITINPFIVLFIAVIIFLQSLNTKRVHNKYYIAGKTLSKYDLHQGIYFWMMSDFSYAKEIRLFNLRKLLLGNYIDSKSKSNNIELELTKDANSLDIINSVLNCTQQILIYSYLLFCVLTRGMAVGTMTIYISVVERFTTSLSLVFNSYLQLANNSLTINEMIDFLKIPLRQETTGNMTPTIKAGSEIEFRNVSFRYPGSQIYALQNISIKIMLEKRLCIVGVNGSGKSTFIKLLTRLYTPSDGEILLDGINIEMFNYHEYLSLFSPVFQDFVNYSFTIGDNIVLNSHYDKDKLLNVCAKSGLEPLIDKLPKGLDTEVNKNLDEEGFEPSGGEEQRIAIARAIYHDATIFLLDEPTAALDPITEYEIYMRFNDMINNKTAIIITHRLSAVQLADTIAVFNAGQIVGYGSHEQLYVESEIYSEMYDKQSEFYRNVDQYTITN